MTETLNSQDRPYRTGEIRLHSEDDFAGMQKAGRLAAECLDMLASHVKAGRYHPAI